MSIYKRSSTHVAELKDLQGAIRYILNPQKNTDDLIYVCGVSKESAFEDMRFLKELYCKTSGRQYLHWILSHDKGVPLEIVKAVNREVMDLIAKEYQVIAATHTNTNNLHTHFILNAVRIKDGKKFSQSRRDMLQFREAVNKILQAQGLKSIGRTEEFEMSEDVEEIEVPVPEAPNFYKSNNVIWAQGTRPFIIEEGNERGGSGTGGLIRPFTIGKEAAKETFRADERQEKLARPFYLENGYPEEDKFLESLREKAHGEKLIRPFLYEEEER